MEQNSALNDELSTSANAPPPANNAEPGQAVMVVTPPKHQSTIHYSFRPDSSFVAHLIAAAANAPQTRVLRRASPEQALASYQGAIERRQDNLSEIGTRASLVA